jgi:hypothetical protein
MDVELKRAAGGLLLGAVLSAPVWAGDAAEAFSMGVEVRERTTLAELGLADYPVRRPTAKNMATTRPRRPVPGSAASDFASAR